MTMFSISTYWNASDKLQFFGLFDKRHPTFFSNKQLIRGKISQMASSLLGSGKFDHSVFKPFPHPTYVSLSFVSGFVILEDVFLAHEKSPA